MENKQQTIALCKQLNLSGAASQLDTILSRAEEQRPGYLAWLLSFLQQEADLRKQKDTAKRIRLARLPAGCDLENYDPSAANGLSRARLNQLLELHWLDQIYNLVLMGPSGTGKTFVSAGLCKKAVECGYKAYFRNMEDIVDMLRMKDVTASAKAEHKRLSQAHLIVIDDIMLLPVDKKDAVSFFSFINRIYEKTSFIITTNKKPVEWVQMLGDEVLATALLDRLLYQCQTVQLEGKSFRLKNRKTIFND